MLLLLALACAPDPAKAPATDDADAPDTDSADTGDATDTRPSCVDEPEPPATRDPGDGPRPAATLAGAVTWSLDFDAEAEALGFADCTYTRSYDQVEVGDQGYLCPECSVLTTGTAVMTEGYDDCYTQISSTDAARVEHLGLGEVDGALHLFRSGSENVRLGDMGAVVGEGPFAVAWEDESALTDGGAMLLSAAGELALGVSDDIDVADVSGVLPGPYACGWPQNSPGGPNLSWDVADGEPFPNVRLADQCGEPVDLWDFRGFYLIIDSSAPNCGPCQAMAEGAEAFKAEMAAECIPVELITLLNESLSAINQPASLEVQQSWAETFGLSSPVLADRGAGYALFPDYLGIDEGMSYPAVVVVDPDGDTLWGATGFGDWTEFADVIRADWEARGE